jgi:hypothetical protein
MEKKKGFINVSEEGEIGVWGKSNYYIVIIYKANPIL